MLQQYCQCCDADAKIWGTYVLYGVHFEYGLCEEHADLQGFFKASERTGRDVRTFFPRNEGKPL